AAGVAGGRDDGARHDGAAVRGPALDDHGVPRVGRAGRGLRAARDLGLVVGGDLDRGARLVDDVEALALHAPDRADGGGALALLLLTGPARTAAGAGALEPGRERRGVRVTAGLLYLHAGEEAERGDQHRAADRSCGCDRAPPRARGQRRLVQVQICHVDDL